MGNQLDGTTIARPQGGHGDDAEMFELAPVSLWLEDYSAVKALFDEWRQAGVTDLREYLHADPGRVKACSQRIRVLKVNRKTLTLFEADDLAHLVGNLDRVFRDDMLKTHIEELVQLWDGQDAFRQQHGQLHADGRAARHPAQRQHPARLRGKPGSAS